MKKLSLLILSVTLSLTAFSQTVTDSTICFPSNVAKRIAKDLVKGDSAIAELKLANQLILALEEKIVVKDTIITQYKAIEAACNEQIIVEQAKYRIAEENLSQVKEELKKEKVNKIKFSVATALVVGLISLIF
jgi:hypothetical protein